MPDYYCKECEQDFKTKKTFTNHILKKHGPPYDPNFNVFAATEWPH